MIADWLSPLLAWTGLSMPCFLLLVIIVLKIVKGD